MKLGIVPKILVPLSILFFILTVLTMRLLLDLFATEQIKTTRQTSLGIASASAMQIDTSVQAEYLKRIMTMIALGDHVIQAVIVDPRNNSILASSLHRYGEHQLETLPLSMQRAYLQIKQAGVYVFTELDGQNYALAYPITAISDNDMDSLDFILLVYFDTLLLDNQYLSYQNRLFIISSIFLLLLISLAYGLIVIFVRRPLDTFETIVRQRGADHIKPLSIDSNDEFEDIAKEFNRMRVTEEKSLVVARKAAQAAETLAAKKSQFLANMSHELRTPINGILGFAQLCQQAKSDQELGQYLQKLTDSSHLLLSVVNDILDFSKLEEKGITLHAESVMLSSLIKNVANLTTVLVSDKGINFDVKVGERCPILITIDKQRFEQVLLNLLGNAVKFTEQGAISLSVNFIWIDDNQGHLLVSIKDTGIGISPDYQETLFDPFEQADTSISRHFGGTGLGLAICKELIDLMDGKIAVESVVDMGSEFVITIACQGKKLDGYLVENFQPNDIPTVIFDESANMRTTAICEAINHYSDSQDSVNLSSIDTNWLQSPFLLDEQTLMESLQHKKWQNQSQSEEVQSDTVKPSFKVLVVEDNEINAIVVVNMLRHLGHKTVVAKNGVEALKVNAQHSFDVILMDVQMPVMDGLEATRKIRESDQSTIIIGLSANVLPDDRQKANLAGMNHYLNKPVLQESLDECLKSLCYQTNSRKCFRHIDS